MYKCNMYIVGTKAIVVITWRARCLIVYYVCYAHFASMRNEHSGMDFLWPVIIYLYVLICIYIYIYIYIYNIYTNINIYVYIYRDIYIIVVVFIYIYIYVCMYVWYDEKIVTKPRLLKNVLIKTHALGYRTWRKMFVIDQV